MKRLISLLTVVVLLCTLGAPFAFAADMEADIVVVGGGLSGLAAAIGGADLGARVIVLEKLGMTGGTANVAGGGFIGRMVLVDESRALENDIPGYMQGWKDAMAFLPSDSGYPDYERLETMLGHVTETMHYFVDNGGEFNENGVIGTVGGLMTKLGESARAKGVEILLETKGTELIVENGIVVGVVAEDKEGTFNVRAKNTIIATGGFTHSEELMQRFVPNVTNPPTQASIGDTGDGFAMLEAVDAVAFTDNWFLCGNPEYAHRLQVQGAGATLDMANQVMVNREGVRIASEKESVWTILSNQMLLDDKAPYYVIHDSSNPDAIAMLEDAVAMGEAFKADTIEALAEVAGLDAQALSGTMSHYAEMVAGGEDTDFGKNADCLKPIETAPFYAVTAYPVIFGSSGGVETDIDGRVLNSKGEVVEGVFAIGEMSNRYFYDLIYRGGASLVLYSAAGRLAAAAAVK